MGQCALHSGLANVNIRDNESTINACFVLPALITVSCVLAVGLGALLAAFLVKRGQNRFDRLIFLS